MGIDGSKGYFTKCLSPMSGERILRFEQELISIKAFKQLPKTTMFYKLLSAIGLDYVPIGLHKNKLIPEWLNW